MIGAVGWGDEIGVLIYDMYDVFIHLDFITFLMLLTSVALNKDCYA